MRKYIVLFILMMLMSGYTLIAQNITTTNSKIEDTWVMVPGSDTLADYEGREPGPDFFGISIGVQVLIFSKSGDMLMAAFLTEDNKYACYCTPTIKISGNVVTGKSNKPLCNIILDENGDEVKKVYSFSFKYKYVAPKDELQIIFKGVTYRYNRLKS